MPTVTGSLPLWKDVKKLNLLARDLSKAIQPLYFSSNYFTKKLFHNTDEIHFNKEDLTEGVSAFSHPLLPGKLIKRQGLKVNSMKPAYVKESMVHNSIDNLEVLPTEDYLGSMSPAARERMIIGQNLVRLRTRLRNRIELMAIEAIKFGRATIEGEGVSVLLEFERHKDLVRKTAKEDEKWSNLDHSILSQLEDYKMKIKDHSRVGAIARTVHLNHKTFSHLRQNKEIREMYDIRRGVRLGIELTPFQDFKDVEYAGNIGGFQFYIHSGRYREKGVEKPILEDGEVLLTADSIGGTRHYGRIISEMAGYRAMEYFIRPYRNEHLESKNYELHSAPLLIPHDVNATAYFKAL
ncbi:major capsid protein [Pseudobacteriovorax antillogorgiicola]|uniref:Phage major capsid protein E n=1 Tax=Pseudobacteriovorax antillogorgiicola TaxID=1513793 RepID=A0A1Y6CVC8_9BACT|nr:major capsid protein [Pseudobacteriovorax antillogorgiicola]TCS44258.1 major capsid protein E [Pseudobacteriovorax antillogorgiicola]SMF80798.1 Phage major capsid protein E [Pseudobacteriovorax antillogorgiicola]